MPSAVECRSVGLVYPRRGKARPVEALSGVDFDVAEGQFVSILGPSGCGKSTLLRIVADLLAPSSGTVKVFGRGPHEARQERSFGFVFQTPVLLPWRSALENVAIMQEVQGVPRAERLAERYGVAFQLTNILRDVREDAEAGRIYLPREDLDRFDVAPEDLAADRPPSSIRPLLEFQATRAYHLYDEAQPLIRLVSPVGRPMLRAIVGIYRALLDEIVRRNYDVLAGRISLPSWRKAAITLRSVVGTSGQ